MGRGPHRQRQGLPAVVEGVLKHQGGQHVRGAVVVPDVVLKVFLRGKAASCGRAASCPSARSTGKLGCFRSFSGKDCKCPGFSRALDPCPQSPGGFRAGQRDWLPWGPAAPYHQGGGVSGESWRRPPCMGWPLSRAMWGVVMGVDTNVVCHTVSLSPDPTPHKGLPVIAP